MLAFMQRALIYHPSRESPILPEDLGYPPGQVHTITVLTDDGLTLHGYHVLPNGVSAADRRECDLQLQTARCLVLYFPGNAGNRTYRGWEVGVLASLGANVFLFDYRGYGDNQGSPSEEHLAKDAQAVWNYATRDRKVAAERVVLYGESIGGGVAVRLAAERCLDGDTPGGLILRSTFSSLVDAAAHHYPWVPVRALLMDRYSSTARIPDVQCPILQLHGTEDRIVPFSLARRLNAACPATAGNGIANRLIALPAAGHNDVLEVAERELRAAIDELLSEIEATTE
jgi:pimeloyl-ACP methyl ester carboxylesterase